MVSNANCRIHTSLSLKSMFVFVPYCEKAIKSNSSSTYWSLKFIHFQQLRWGSSINGFSWVGINLNREWQLNIFELIDRSKEQYLSVTYAKFFINQTNGSRDIVKCTSKHKGCMSKHTLFIKHTVLNWEPLWRRVALLYKCSLSNSILIIVFFICTYLPKFFIAIRFTAYYSSFLPFTLCISIPRFTEI